MQGNVLVKENTSYSISEAMLDEYAENDMFYLDFYHDCYSISASAMFKFNLPETRFPSIEAMLRAFVYEEDIPYMLQGILQMKTGFLKNRNLECRCYDNQGEIIWISCHCELIKDNWKQNNVVIGTIVELEEAYTDNPMQELKADAQFISDLCSSTNSSVHTTGFVMKLGIDNIKEVNERHGLHIANKILQCTLDCILHSVDEQMQVYRIGTEKFILFNRNGATLKDAEKLYKCIKEEINKCNEQIDYPVFYTISAGAAGFDSCEENYIEICKKVDFAFNTAMRRGKNEVFLFEQEEYEQYIRRLDIEEKLRRDVKNNFRGFRVFYQPIVDVDTERVTGAEALLRWSCEEYQNLSPAVFVPILEESSLIVPVGRWVMKCAVKQCKEWQKQIAGFRMNINVSYIQLKKSDVAFDVIHDLKENELDSKYVLFELTESGFVETDSSIRHIIKSFQKQKIKLGLDDFGTGYSNLCYLNDLKVYIIKIDRTFVMKALKSNYHYKLLKHIIDMAHSIHLKVCIEGVEKEEELCIIKELNPDYIQGYYFGRPVDEEAFYEQNIKAKETD